MTTVPKPTALTTTYTCSYDAWNRLVEVKSGETVVAKYEYDATGRRIKAHIDAQAPAEPNGVDHYRHFFYNASWQILETRKATNVATEPETLDPEFQYVWSLRYIDGAVLRDENKDDDDDCIDGQDERLYYLTDANMNVTALVQGKSGHEDLGKVVERYIYDPYGKVTTLHGDPTADADGGEVTEWAEDASPDWDNCILYCGYYHDWETGLYHVRRRYYHPPLGRWLQRDPIGYVDGMSLYEYAGSRPGVATDPLGHVGIVRGRNKLNRLWIQKQMQESLDAPIKFEEIGDKTSRVTLEKKKKEDDGEVSDDTKLLKKLIESKRTVTFSSGAETIHRVLDGQAASDGTGSDSEVIIDSNPHRKRSVLEDDGRVSFKSLTTQEKLEHEMIHAGHAMEGTLTTGPHTYTDLSGRQRTEPAEEVRTIGCAQDMSKVPGYRKGDTTMNEIRGRRGEKPRPYHTPRRGKRPIINQ